MNEFMEIEVVPGQDVSAAQNAINVLIAQRDEAERMVAYYKDIAKRLTAVMTAIEEIDGGYFYDYIIKPNLLRIARGEPSE